MSKAHTIVAIVLVAIVAAPPIIGSPAWADADANEARQALERGDIHPLDQVLEVARKQLPGDVVKIKLEHDDGRWTYEIKILTDKGERREIEIDATSLRILEVE